MDGGLEVAERGFGFAGLQLFAGVFGVLGQVAERVVHRLARLRGGLLPGPGPDHALDLGVVDECALRPDGAEGVAAHVEHVALAEQLFSAGLVHDHAGVGAGGGGEGDAGREIGLDQAGDDVDGGALGGDDQVDAGGAGELREADELLFDVDRGGHHHVGELVEHDDPVGHRLGGRGQRVVGGDVARAEFFEAAVAAVHFADHDAEHGGDLVGFGDDVGEGEVGDAGVVGEFDALGVDEDEADLLRGLLHEQAGDDRVDADGLAGAGRAGDQHVGHLGEVGDDGLAGDAAAERDREPALGRLLLEGVGFDQAADADDALLGVGHLDADDGLAGHGRFDPDRGGGEGEGEVVAESGDAVDADAGARDLFLDGAGRAVLVAQRLAVRALDGDRLGLDLPARLDAELGDRGALVDLGDGGVDAEGGEGFDDDAGGLLGAVADFVVGRVFIEQVDGRQAPAVVGDAREGARGLPRVRGRRCRRGHRAGGVELVAGDGFERLRRRGGRGRFRDLLGDRFGSGLDGGFDDGLGLRLRFGVEEGARGGGFGDVGVGGRGCRRRRGSRRRGGEGAGAEPRRFGDDDGVQPVFGCGRERRVLVAERAGGLPAILRGGERLDAGRQGGRGGGVDGRDGGGRVGFVDGARGRRQRAVGPGHFGRAAAQHVEHGPAGAREPSAARAERDARAVARMAREREHDRGDDQRGRGKAEGVADRRADRAAGGGPGEIDAADGDGGGGEADQAPEREQERSGAGGEPGAAGVELHADREGGRAGNDGEGCHVRAEAEGFEQGGAQALQRGRGEGEPGEEEDGQRRGADGRRDAGDVAVVADGGDGAGVSAGMSGGVERHWRIPAGPADLNAERDTPGTRTGARRSAGPFRPRPPLESP